MNTDKENQTKPKILNKACEMRISKRKATWPKNC